MPYFMNSTDMIKKILFLNFLLITYQAVAQDTISLAPINHPDIIKREVNVINNSVSLSSFYDKLYQLRQKKVSTVSILHIGDSHIQGDILTNTVRKNFQLEFGNAGRGLVFPGRVGRTNEGSGIYSSTNSTWDAKRIIYLDHPPAIGISGMTIQTKQAGASFSLRVSNNDALSYSFNQLTLFYQKDFSSFNVAVKDSTGADLAYAGPYTVEDKNISRVRLPHTVSQVQLQTVQSLPTQNQFSLYGLILGNGKPGVFYHSTGGNGAKVKHYLGAEHFNTQTTELLPDLIVISLGTNEAIEYPYIDPKFEAQLKEFVDGLRQANPNAQVLLTIPMDFYRKKTRRNPGVEQVREKIIAFAESHHLAYWDLYLVGGGKHAADHWKKNELLQSDGIHFTKAGYTLQGNLLYEALLKGYNEYVRYRYP